MACEEGGALMMLGLSRLGSRETLGQGGGCSLDLLDLRWEMSLRSGSGMICGVATNWTSLLILAH
jgi:hypothetical protein